MNGSSCAEGGREAPPVRGRVVPFRTSARIAMLPARRAPRFMPGVLIQLEERRAPRRPPGGSSKIKWLVVGSVATLRLFLVKLILKRGPATNADAGMPALSDEFSLSAAAEHRL